MAEVQDGEDAGQHERADERCQRGVAQAQGCRDAEEECGDDNDLADRGEQRLLE